ncbi:MAG: M67 family metallopeptidase [Actinomycetota bacterium]|nr:M67 family metallopeptidase [Actinomycetota bacterium]
MLAVPDELIAEVIAHAREGQPEEVCGWLAGRGNRVERVYPVPNASEDPERDFRMEPEAQLSAMLEIREAGLDLTATYHSHPRTPAEPSAKDLALAAYPDSFHLIVSLANGRPEIRCYRVTEQEGCRLAVLLVEYAYRDRGTPRCS